MTCSVKWCGKSSRKSNLEKDGITFHKFPKDPETKAAWVEATKRGNEWFPTLNSVICSRHFTEDSFHCGKRRRIMETAVPTLYLPILIPNTKDGVDYSHTDNSTSANHDLFLSKMIPSSPSHDTEQLSPVNLSTSAAEEPPTNNNAISSPYSPSAYSTPTEKRLCRRIMELENILKRKNKLIKQLRDQVRPQRSRASEMALQMVEVQLNDEDSLL